MNPKDLRIAVVAQDCYHDLYSCKPDAPPIEKILSTRSRCGLCGLFTLYNADFYTVEIDSAPECQIWKEKAISRPVDGYRKNAQRHKHIFKCGDINWGKYDIVISMYVAVPIRITTKFRKTLWCYMISEVYMPHFAKPVINGYDAKLNQHLGIRIAEKRGAVDFPYSFIEPESLARIGKSLVGEVRKAGVFQEYNSVQAGADFNKLGFGKFGPVRTIVRRVNDKDHIKKTIINLYKSKYFVKRGGRHVRGNGLVEAISAGQVIVASKKVFIYQRLIDNRCDLARPKFVFDMISKLEQDNKLYNTIRRTQNELMWKYVIRRPMRSLMHLYKLKTGG